MNTIRHRFIIYALIGFSLSVFFIKYQVEDIKYIFSDYFLCPCSSNTTKFEELFVRSYILISDKPSATENPALDIDDGVKKDSVDAKYLSDDSDFVFKSQNSLQLDCINQTDYTIDVQSLLAEKPNFGFKMNNEPEILIVHTHASESYGYERDYQLMDTDRTQDVRYNMIRVGEELKKCLEQKGYMVLHDKTIHDYPSYTSSYKKAGETIEKYLKTYPSLVAVFDIHRDAIVDENGKCVGLVTELEGEKCAQIMIVCGTDKNNLPFDLWEENLRFAVKIQDYMEKTYPGLMRPINLRKERFNLHLTRGSLLFEIGTNGNSLKQALASVKYIADGIDYGCKKVK